MTPTQQGNQQWTEAREVSSNLDSESIVISGMSGLFPKSHSVKELSDILYNKINPVTSDDSPWKWTHPEASKYIGKVPDLERFDSRFFMVHHHLAKCMDSMARKVLEQSYQAIYDAGMSPKHVTGKRVGVYIGTALFDTQTTFDSTTGYGMSGRSKTMYPNRISYWLDAKGPSMTMDNVCCSFTVALEEAYSNLKQGLCEAAIVGGCSFGLYPKVQVHYSRCIQISPDATTKSFDKNANGCTKSEAVGVILLQKAKDAVRAYAELVHVKNAFVSKLTGGTGQVFGFVRDPNTTANFLEQFYLEANVRPQAVEYIEAFGSATPEADKAELQAIEKVFCGNRSDPVYVGSVISNIGYTDFATGATAITKVLLGYHNGLIASNLHCDTPRQDVEAIRDGRIRVVKDHLPFQRSFAAINCLSVTGVNSHILLRGCSKPKDKNRYAASIPRLVNVSARQQEYIGDLFEDLKSRPIDPEELALLHNIHSTDISGHLGRGYIILDTNEQQKTISLSEQMDHCDNSQRPLWFVYSGMGSQWAGMGAQFMRIPIFAAAIERCHKVLEPKGINIFHIIMSEDKTIFDDILNSFVGIASIQIGLTDLLVAMGLRPDKIIGHSVGECGCAYADGCLTTEEMILSAYSRGKVSNETLLIRGAMAAVGLGYRQLKKRCPAEIEIACHNGPDSCTISGPEKILREFVASLVADGIFAKEVLCSNIAYHSRYIADAGPNLLRYMSEIIKKPRERSARWLSTSVPQEKWHEPLAKYCSAEYFTNNLLSSVYFEETCSLIPSNAVLIEIAPHGILQAILTRSLPQSCTNLPLTQRGHRDNALFFLEAIGKLYIAGYTPLVQAIYPKVDFPVSSGTPHLSHLVKWSHESWETVTCNENPVKTASSCKFLITTHDDDHRYLNGNVINGRVLYPFAAALVAVWDTLAMTIGSPKKNVSVEFNDIHLYSQPILHSQKSVKLSVCLHRGSGLFEVLDGESKVATGYIACLPKSGQMNGVWPNRISENLLISSEEIYKHFSNRGFSYRDDFRTIHSVDESLSVAQLHWNNNWATLIDGLLQLNILRHTYNGVTQVTHIKKLTINVKKHLALIRSDARLVNAEINDILDRTSCGSIVLQNIKFRNVSLLTQGKLKLIPLLSANNNISINMDNVSEKNMALVIGNAGDLDTLHWEEAPMVSGNDVKVMVEYAGINITDINRATKGIQFYDNKKYYGMDFSGVTESGERVMGIVQNGAARKVVSARVDLLWPVPAHWTLEDAATVPLAYVQVYFCFYVKTKLRSGSRVLIHGGAGALGQAAISIALAHGCQVFTTVGNTIKKRHLLKLFPQLNENMIGNSRDASFGDLVLNATNGEGCHIILNCSKGKLRDISLKCTAFSGVTIDTVLLQNQEKYEYGMFNMTKSRSFITVDFYSIFDSEDTELRKKLQKMLCEGIARGHVRPLSRVTYSAQEASRAFRLLAASRNCGRVLLQLQDVPPLQHRMVCSAENSSLIIWDGSSFGLQFADKLISRGVSKLRIHCMSSTSHQHIIKLLLWQKMGIDVQILSENLNRSDAVSEMLNETNRCGPIEGIFVISALTADDKKVTEVASVIARLDIASRILCPFLKYFGVITANCNIGHNTCISRSKDGYPVTALTLPAPTNGEGLDHLNEESTWNRYAVDVTEKALRSGIPVQVARPQPQQKLSLIKLIAAFADNDNEACTLQDLGLTESLPLIKSFLNDVYQVSFNYDNLLKLTKERILKIETSSSERKLVENKGLHTFYSHVELDELHATANFIPVDTLGHDIKPMQDSIDETKTYIFVIPGLEGRYTRFVTLCEHLKLPAIVLQPGLDFPNETPVELALRYSKVLLEKFKVKKNFYLLAYECGIFSALELAGILEDNDLTGTVYCIGDGPKEMQALLEEELSEYGSEEALQAGVVRHMSALMLNGEPCASVESSWSARVEECVRELLGRNQHSAQYMRAIMEAAYARICVVRRHSAQPRALRSRIVLARARHTLTGRECSLQLHSQNPLLVRDLATSMEHAAFDLRAPAFINSHLDDDILEMYNNNNLCDTYNILM